MKEKNVQKAMPMIMLAFILAGSLQEAFNVCAPIISKDFSITSSEVSLVSAVAMLTMGVAYVVYTALSDFMSIKKLLVVGIVISAIGSAAGVLFSNSFLAVIVFRAIQILVVLVTYSTQGSYSFLFFFMASEVHGIEASRISMILLPSYAVSMAIGILGSKITQKAGVTKTLAMALGSMALGLVLGSFFLDKSVILLAVMSCLFNGGFSILYTPIMTLVINSLPERMRGTGLGFFNLCIKITSSTGIVITGRLLTLSALQGKSLVSSMPVAGKAYSNILLIFLCVVVVSFVTINIVKKFLIKK